MSTHVAPERASDESSPPEYWLESIVTMRNDPSRRATTSYSCGLGPWALSVIGTLISAPLDGAETSTPAGAT